MITAQEAREISSDRYEELVNAIDKAIRVAAESREKSIYYYSPYEEGVKRALEEHGFTVQYTRDPRKLTCWHISWS